MDAVIATKIVQKIIKNLTKYIIEIYHHLIMARNPYTTRNSNYEIQRK